MFLIEEKSLQDYCVSVNFGDKNSRSLMEYDFINKTIAVYYEYLLSNYNKQARSDQKKFQLNEKETINYLNSKILLAILHEINHIKQGKIINEEISDLSQLLRVSVYWVNEQEKFYKILYSEYHANINAYYYLINIFLNNNKIISFIQNNYLASFLLEHYYIDKNPIETFYKDCLNENGPYLFIERMNKRENNINDILLGRTIDRNKLEYTKYIAERKIRSLNLFKDIYN